MSEHGEQSPTGAVPPAPTGGPVPPEQPVGGPTDPLEPWPETVRWQPVSQDLIWVEALRLSIGMLVVIAGLLIGLVLTGSWPFGLALGLAVLLTVWRLLVIARAVRAWGYAERDNDLLVRHGLLVRRLSIVPYARMQFVDVTAGPLERAFKLATVQLHTAAAASDARVPGLRPAEASRLRDRLTALGEDRAEGI
ncbi:membrane protein YdbS with pleckstrin-like domain [Plantactinospora soyae]|uniref:Membrane protein YdbS with pleckstrin-like domain n=1 Tax=Plantactinospora soyae TaxID=1544732 RepID=A0A927MFC4_9ACTN|nr:membrane protein YdbS with pleckstrin-like domain [Plantactinospora soyae]